MVTGTIYPKDPEPLSAIRPGPARPTYQHGPTAYTRDAWSIWIGLVELNTLWSWFRCRESGDWNAWRRQW